MTTTTMCCAGCGEVHTWATSELTDDQIALVQPAYCPGCETAQVDRIGSKKLIEAERGARRSTMKTARDTHDIRIKTERLVVSAEVSAALLKCVDFDKFETMLESEAVAYIDMATSSDFPDWQRL